MSEDIYAEANVPVFEAIYGKGLISLGGLKAVDNMFAGVELKGKRLLDIGSGIGGMAHYLAQKHGCHVTGLELYDWMATYATKHAPTDLANQLQFITYDASGAIPLDDSSIDIVFSKGVLTNVKDKATLFANIYRVLVVGGQIIFVDWLVPENNRHGTELLAMGDMSYKETQSTYTALLQGAGFRHISFTDNTKEYLEYVNQLDTMYRSKQHIEQYANIISNELRAALIDSNLQLKEKITAGKQLSMLITANK